jgi:omega-amidase
MSAGAHTLAATALAASLTFFAVSHRRVVSVSRRPDKVAARLERERLPSRRSAVTPTGASSSDLAGGNSSPADRGVDPAVPLLLRATAVECARVPAPKRDPRSGTHAGKVKVALCQLRVGSDKGENIEAAVAAIRAAAQDGAELVVLPEMWNCPYANASFPVYAEVIDPISRFGTDSTSIPGKDRAPSAAALSAVAKETGVVVVGGSIPERCSVNPDALYNSCCVFDNDGVLVAKHRKAHLFDIDIPNEISFKESDTLTSGDALTVVDTAVGRLGIGICFDIRFPEVAAVCANRGASVLVYPGAFNTVTGPLHWELLQRARAVDNQCFVLTCSPARDAAAKEKTPPGYEAWGHSTVVGPFAEILATTQAEPAIVTCEIDLGEIARRRRDMPLEKQRRGDLYALVDVKAIENAT